MTRNYAYKGWTITYDPGRPVTGTWRAEKFGVGVCHNSMDGVKRLVDNKESDSWRRIIEPAFGSPRAAPLT